MMTTREAKINKVIENRQEGIIVLQDIHDPHNAAATFRSAEAFGFQKVYLIFEQEERFNPKQVGKASSSSANKWLTFEVFTSTTECLKSLKEQGYTIYATVLDEQSKSIYKTKFKDNKVALLLGNEHRGLSATAIQMADKKIYIPMKGMVQSLNLSVTAAICMYELRRQKQGKETGLSEIEKEGIKQNWRWRK